MMNDENEDVPQAIKAESASISEQIVSSNVSERTIHNDSGSITSSSDAQKLNASVKAQSWESTLEKTIKAIISIKANRVRCFDTDKAGQSYLKN